jgi:hypothetical protein
MRSACSDGGGRPAPPRPMPAAPLGWPRSTPHARAITAGEKTSPSAPALRPRTRYAFAETAVDRRRSSVSSASSAVEYSRSRCYVDLMPRLFLIFYFQTACDAFHLVAGLDFLIFAISAGVATLGSTPACAQASPRRVHSDVVCDSSLLHQARYQGADLARARLHRDVTSRMPSPASPAIP